MNFKDIILSPEGRKTQKWQLGSLISNEMKDGGVAILFVPDFRGANGKVETLDLEYFRSYFYNLSRQDFSIPIIDLGELIAGKTLADTHYILQEVVATCLQRAVLPIIIGGGADLAYSLFSSLNHFKENIRYTHISNTISFEMGGEDITERNFLSKILRNQHFSLADFNLLGYQRHLNPLENLHLMNELGFGVVRLAEMMNAVERVEPFFRRADLVTLNCDAIASVSGEFSIYPQVNGLNSREICVCMREIGLSENLKILGIFNFNFSTQNILGYQLLAQMLWYFMEGLHIQRTHPKERVFETFMLMLGEESLVFKRDTFSDVWYFGKDENIENCTPCTREDYENAKRGILNKRLK